MRAKSIGEGGGVRACCEGCASAVEGPLYDHDPSHRIQIAFKSNSHSIRIQLRVQIRRTRVEQQSLPASILVKVTVLIPLPRICEVKQRAHVRRLVRAAWIRSAGCRVQGAWYRDQEMERGVSSAQRVLGSGGRGRIPAP